MRKVVLEELQFSVLMVLSRGEVVPRFRVMTPEGDWIVFVPLPDEQIERERRMRLLHGFMAWKSATATIRQKKTGRPVRFELTDQTRSAVDEYLRVTGRKPGQFLFAGRGDGSHGLTTRQYARLVHE